MKILKRGAENNSLAKYQDQMYHLKLSAVFHT